MQRNVILQLVLRAHCGFCLEAELHRSGGLLKVFKAMKKRFSSHFSGKIYLLLRLTLAQVMAAVPWISAGRLVPTFWNCTGKPGEK